MKVRILLFAQMRIAARRGQLELDLPEDSRLEAALDRLWELHPELEPHARSCLTAIGLDYAPVDQPLRDGDEISLIPPVQGG